MGDFILFCSPPPPLRDLSNQPELALYTPNRWPKGKTEIHVRFLGGDPFVWRRIVNVITGADGWNAVCALQFVFEQADDAEVRVSFERGGSWSYEGDYAARLPQSEPTMNFGWLTRDTSDEEVRRVALHEFGHALGAIHEHQNPLAKIPWRREAVYAYYAKQGWDRDMVDAQVLTPTSPSVVESSGYDPTSIMHYWMPPEFVTDDSFAASGSTRLSARDKATVATWYGAPEQPEPPAPSPAVLLPGIVNGGLLMRPPDSVEP